MNPYGSIADGMAKPTEPEPLRPAKLPGKSLIPTLSLFTYQPDKQAVAQALGLCPDPILDEILGRKEALNDRTAESAGN